MGMREMKDGESFTPPRDMSGTRGGIKSIRAGAPKEADPVFVQSLERAKNALDAATKSYNFYCGGANEAISIVKGSLQAAVKEVAKALERLEKLNK